MPLTAEDFALILGLSDLGSHPDGGTDKRRANRVSHHVECSIVPPGAREAVSVAVGDLSPRGLLIFYCAPLSRGEQFVVYLTGKGGKPTSLLCTVAHCRQKAPHEYAIGAEFTCVLDQSPPHTRKVTIDMDRIRKSILD